MRRLLILTLTMTLFLMLACDKSDSLTLVTTTSAENSGLIHYLTPHFKEETGLNVKVVAKGTGAAIKLAENGQADVMLVHDKAREMVFMDEGYGEKRADLMYNHFIFVGPEQIEHEGSLSSFLNALHEKHSFLSRGDESGTHAKEKALWNQVGLSISPASDWYDEAGQGMESTLSMASLQGYYTLCDRGTFLSMRDTLNLDVVYEDNESLLNPYGLIKISDELHNRDTDKAELFYQWLISEEAQTLIENYTVDGETLFYTYD